MLKIDPMDACPICGKMGDHKENCPRYPKEWRECEHWAYSPGTPDAGHCIKCGKAIW